MLRLSPNHWLLNRPVAHRGLWDKNIIENSITAYQNAVDKNYPIEIDVYLTKDGHLVSFHDNTLKRMTGADGNIYDKTLNELNSLYLLDEKGNKTSEKIPTFDQVLALAENKVPLLIEIKNQPDSSVVDKVVERLKSYKGEFALQSFNPLYILRVKKLAPSFIRGVLGTADANDKSTFKNFIVKTMPFNFLIKPDFVSYEDKFIPKFAKKTKKTYCISWTITNSEREEKVSPFVDNIIFENYVPKKYL